MRLLVGVVFILFLLIQISGVSFFDILGVTPNWILCFCLALVILTGFEKTWWLFLISGFFLDLHSDLPFGLESLSLIFSVYSVDWFGKKVFSVQRFWTKAYLLAAGIVIYYLLILAAIKMFGFVVLLDVGYFVSLFGYNLILSILLVYGAKKILYQKKAKRNY